jgi:hypothetical protein
VATGYLLDTNVISETRKTRADSGVIAFLSAAETAGATASPWSRATPATLSPPARPTSILGRYDDDESDSLLTDTDAPEAVA